MKSSVKLQSKMLLSHDTWRLFSVSAVGFIVRTGTVAMWLYFLVSLFESGIINSYLESYNAVTVYSLVIFDIAFVSGMLILFITALRIGEQFLYFIKASGGRGRFLLLFHFFTFKSSFRALFLYLRLFTAKILWLMYYLFPCFVCYGITYYLYTFGNLLPTVFYTLIAGSSVLLSVSLFMCRITFFRYKAAEYYLCLNSEIKPKDAIKKSIRYTDGFLKESALLESSFLGWFLSCVFVLPLVYVVPYFKLSKAVFVNECVNGAKYPLKNKHYAINYIKIQ